jgi:hypothetical protein
VTLPPGTPAFPNQQIIDFTKLVLNPNAAGNSTLSGNSTALNNFAYLLAERVLSTFSAEGLQADLLAGGIANLFLLAVPQSVLNDPRALAYLQSYVLGQLDKTFLQRASLGSVGELVINRVVSVLSGMIADAVGFAVVQSTPGLNQDSWQVISIKLAVDMAIQSAYGARTEGGIGAIAGAASAAAGQIYNSILLTRDVLASTESAFKAAEQSAVQLRQLAMSIESTNPAQAAKLLKLADDSDRQTAALRSALNQGLWNKVLGFSFAL